MMQVDVFVAPGAGAVFAAASAHAGRVTGQRHLLGLLLWVAVFFVPATTWFAWDFPEWETMGAGDASMPGWVVAVAALGRAALSVLGFVVARWLLSRGRVRAAGRLVFGAFAAMAFVLVHGWDGTGYQRVFRAGGASGPATWSVSDAASLLVILVAVAALAAFGTIFALDSGGVGGRLRFAAASLAVIEAGVVTGASAGVAAIVVGGYWGVAIAVTALLVGLAALRSRGGAMLLGALVHPVDGPDDLTAPPACPVPTRNGGEAQPPVRRGEPVVKGPAPTRRGGAHDTPSDSALARHDTACPTPVHPTAPAGVIDTHLEH